MLKTRFSLRKKLALSALIAGSIAWHSEPVNATQLYWDVNQAATGFSTVVGGWNGTNAFWNNASTGTGGTLTAVTNSTDDLFISQATANTGSITLTGTQNAGSITFLPNVGPTTTITAGTINLGGGVLSGIFQQSSGANIVASPVTLNAPTTNFSLSNSGAGLLTISGTVTGSAAGAQTLNFGASSTGGITSSGIISNGGGGGAVGVRVNSSGAGVTIFTGVNTYTGGTTIASGTLRAQTSASVFGTGTLTLGDSSVSGGAAAATFIHNFGGAIANNIVLATGVTADLTIQNVNTSTAGSLSGTITGNNNFKIATGTTTFTVSGLVDNAGSITNVGAGTSGVVFTGGISANVTGITQAAAVRR